jgi:hypothetical protein
MRRGVVTLRSKQYEEYLLSVLNERREFMQIILTIGDSLLKMMRRVATLHGKQYGENRLSAINNGGESIKNRKYLIEF